MDGWMVDRWIGGWMDAYKRFSSCMDGWMLYVCVFGCMETRIGELISRYIGGWMIGGWKDRWMDGCI